MTTTAERLDELEREFPDAFSIGDDLTLAGELLSIARGLVKENDRLQSTGAQLDRIERMVNLDGLWTHGLTWRKKIEGNQ
jgi:hypothetical protein